MTSDLNLDWLISVDDHVLEPPTLGRPGARPRTVTGRRTWSSRATWSSGSTTASAIPSSGLSAVAGKSKEEFSPEPVTYAEMRPGCYDAEARIEDMDRAGILASLCFPTFTRFCGQLFMEASDREFGFVCLQAYNDWMIEEWCGAAPGRYIPLILIPMWDPPLAAKEMERCAAKGATAFAFSENPAPLGLPTIHDQDRYWDPVMAAASDLEMVRLHARRLVVAGARRSRRTRRSWPTSPGGPSAPRAPCCRGSSAACSPASPDLKIALSEGEIGWMPYFLERAEQVLDKQRFWVQRGVTVHGARHHRRGPGHDRHPPALFRDHVFGCFIDDTTASPASTRSVRTTSCARPTTRTPTRPGRTASASSRSGSATCPPEVQYKLLRGNAERLYRFTPAEPPALPVRAASSSITDDRIVHGRDVHHVRPGTFAHDEEA